MKLSLDLPTWILVALFALAASLPLKSVHGAPPAPTRFDQGDAAFKKRGDQAQAKQALDEYRKLFTETPNDPEAGWRFAMACYFYGLRFMKDKKLKHERADLYKEGRDAGRAALKAKPECAPCHFWTAINMALYGDTVGILKTLFTLGEIKDHLKESLGIDPKYAYSGAYRLLGLIEQKLPGILGGSDDRAREYLEKAIATSPDEPLNYEFLAKLLEDEFDDPKTALEVAKKGLAVPPPSEERLESREALVTLKKLADELAQRKID